MRKRIRQIFTVLVMTLGAVCFAGKPQPTSGQRMSDIPSNRKPACSIFCGDATMNYVVMGEPPACFGGPLPAGDAGNQSKKLKDLPAENRKGYCEYLRTHNPNSSCPVFKTLMAACDQDEKESPEDQPPPETQPFPPPVHTGPWNPDPSNCKDFQPVRFRRVKRTINEETHNWTQHLVEFVACGKVLGTVVENVEDPDSRWIKFMWSMWPDSVCCDRLNAHPGPCGDYFSDVDCDGNPNQTDDFPDNYVEQFVYTTPRGSAPDPLPQGLRRQQILPGSACDGGKWELLKGNNRCKAKGNSTSLAWYEATWKCPTTGMKVSKTGSATLLRQKCK